MGTGLGTLFLPTTLCFCQPLPSGSLDVARLPTSPHAIPSLPLPFLFLLNAPFPR